MGAQLADLILWLLVQTIGRVAAKGVAGIGKAGNGEAGGVDKAGQQVPPEVYNALTWAGTAFLFTLSVPLILYSLNKLLDKIEDCFNCGGSERRKAARLRQAANVGPSIAATKPPGSAHYLAQNQQQAFQSQSEASKLANGLPGRGYPESLRHEPVNGLVRH